MATTQDIETLKYCWRNDPCWDIEESEGFEEHKEELREYRLETEKMWEAKRYDDLQEKSRKMGIPGNLTLTRYIEVLESKIDSLERELERKSGW